MRPIEVTPRRVWSPWLVAVGVAVVFALSVAVPQDTALWLLYFAPLGASTRLGSPNALLVVAAVSTVLLFVAIPLQPVAHVELEVLLFNRGLAAALLWWAAVLMRQRRLEEHQLQRLASIVQSANDAIVASTMDWRITDWNPAAERMYGYTRAEILGRPAATIVPPERMRELADNQARMLSGEGVHHLETERLRKDGTRFPVSLSLSQIRDSLQRPVGVSMIARDLTSAQASANQLRALARRLESVQEAERAAIARELHDDLGQALTVLRMDAMRLAGVVTGVPDAAGLVAEINRMLEEMLHRVRSLAMALHPSALDDLGLDAAIEVHATQVARRAGLRLSLALDPMGGSVDRTRAGAVYRVLQESLTNVVRHAEATAVTIELQADAEAIRLRVTDDGRGLPPPSEQGGRSLGLLGMRERAAEFGGRVDVTRHEPRGTRVELEIPREGGGGE